MPPKRPLHRVTLQLTAGAAPVVDLGKMLGQTGVNLIEVKRRYDEAAMRTVAGTARSTGVRVAD